MTKNPLRQLRDYGQSVWYDNLSRGLLESGGLQQLIDESGVVGVTSNPTIFDKAISGSADYDDQIRELVAAGRNTDEIYEELVVRDIQQAADTLRPVFEHTDNNAGDGFVSLEVSPTLAHDTEKTMADARRLFARVDRPNVMIKIPGTPEGLPAVEQMLYEGVNVNITLLFSLDAYRAVAEAYLRALERRAEEGKSLAGIASVASFFVSRVDTEADKRLQAIVDGEPGSARATQAQGLLGTLAVANAKLAYQAFLEIFSGPRWEALAAQGAKVQRPLWASTSTKNPAYSDTLYVDELIGPHTVQTLAPASIEAFGDHGRLGETLTSDLDGARAVFRGFEELGIAYDDITDTLVREGVASFAKSFETLLAGLEEKRARFQAELQAGQDAGLGDLSPKVRAAHDDLSRQDIVRRLREQDPTLWLDAGAEPNHPGQRLTWQPVVETMLALARAGVFRTLQDEVRARGYERAVLFGMGGSSLGPEFLAGITPAGVGFPPLTVLDTTNPATIARLAGELRDRRTLFIVSTKSGTTVETMALYRYFLEQRGGDASDFIAVTDPDTPLDHEAQERGFWKTYRTPSDIGGRYSAISLFGLIGAAVHGIDVEELLLRARRLLPIHDAGHPGVWLGAAIAAARHAGRDKVTIVTPPGWEPFADWLEQILAESTGKRHEGVVPTTNEPLVAGRISDDRLVIHYRLAGGDAESDATVATLREAGAPVVTIDIDGPLALGAEVVRWDIATTVAGGLIGVNPFDESGFQETKDVIKALLAGETLADPPATPVDEAARALLALAQPGGYLAILAFVDRTPEVEDALRELRRALAERTGLPTSLGWGPRYLHALGQLHREGPGRGAVLQIGALPEQDIAIPGAGYGFRTLFAAQLAADAITLTRSAVPLVRVDASAGPVDAIRALSDDILAGQPA